MIFYNRAENLKRLPLKAAFSGKGKKDEKIICLIMYKAIGVPKPFIIIYKNYN